MKYSGEKAKAPFPAASLLNLHWIFALPARAARARGAGKIT